MPSLSKYLKVLVDSKMNTKAEFRMFMTYAIAIGVLGIGVLTILLKILYPILYIISFVPLWMCITLISAAFGTIIYIYENHYKSIEDKNKGTQYENDDWI